MKRIEEMTWAEVKAALRNNLALAVAAEMLEAFLKKWQQEQMTYTMQQDKQRVAECRRLAAQPVVKRKQQAQEHWADDLWHGI